MGRPKKPIQKHIADKTYRRDRHGPIGNVPTTTSEPPAKPADLDVNASQLWDEAIASLPGGLCEADGAILELACRWWSIARQSLLDGDVVTAGAAGRRFESCAAKLGLSPADRQKMFVPPPKEVDELDQLRLLRVNQ